MGRGAGVVDGEELTQQQMGDEVWGFEVVPAKIITRQPVSQHEEAPPEEIGNVRKRINRAQH